MKTAWVWFPGAPYTQECALRAAQRVLGSQGWKVVEGPEEVPLASCYLYFADYDVLPFEHLHPAAYTSLNDGASTSNKPFPQLSCYSIRKALIRKNHLANSLHLARVKKTSARSGDVAVKRVPSDVNGKEDTVAPKTWVFEATYADDLDELLADDLYDLQEELQRNLDIPVEERRWYILKPAMADRGMGIRLLDTEQALRNIFAEFEDEEDDEDEDEDDDGNEHQGEEADGDAERNEYEGGRATISKSSNDRKGESETAIIISQLRHFVIQEYVARPLLVEAPGLSGPHKFHIRAYVLAQGSLRVYLYDNMLALFAPKPYEKPGKDDDDLSSHLTNTCLQEDQTATVHLLQDLLGCPFAVTSGKREKRIVTQDILDTIRLQASGIVAESFQACANADRVHFQPWPYSWEIFGVDMLVEIPQDTTFTIKVWLLEVNAQPDFARTGDELQNVIDSLFERVLQLTATDTPSDDEVSWKAGESRNGMTLCLDMPSGAIGW